MNRRHSTAATEDAPAVLGVAGGAYHLEHLLGVGIEVRALGWCMGPVTRRDIGRDADGRLYRRVRWVPLRWFRRHGPAEHDRGCFAIGIPEKTLQELVPHCTCSADRALAALLTDVAFDVVRTLEPVPWARDSAREIARGIIRKRLG